MSKKSPKRLQRLAARAVNKKIFLEEHIDLLEIPTVCKAHCKTHYLMDKFHCEDILSGIDLEELDLNIFDDYFYKCTNDEWLAIQCWNGKCIPDMAYEVNHVKLKYYVINHINHRLCFDCMGQIAHNIEKRPVYVERHTWCDTVGSGDLIDQLQCMEMWCDNCTTTALFRIEDWPFSARHQYHTGRVFKKTFE